MISINEIVPLSGIRQNDNNGTWESIDYDPQFKIETNTIYKKWINITFKSSVEESREVKLYIDHGNGYNEDNSQILGVINSEKTSEYSYYVCIGNSVKNLRLDIGNTPGIFKIIDFNIRNLNKLHIIKESINQYLKKNDTTIISLLFKILKEIPTMGIRGIWNKGKGFLNNNNEYNENDYITYYFKEEKLKKLEIEESLISLIIPHNQEDNKYLNECINSINSQGVKPHEIIIIGNVDNINLKQENLKLIKSIKSTDVELINEAICISSGEYVLIISEEDLLSVNTLYYYQNYILGNKNDEIIYCDEDKFDTSGQFYAPIYKKFYKKNIVKTNYDNGICIKKSILFKNKYEYVKNNIWRYKTAHIEKVLYHKRVGIKNIFEKKLEDKLKPIAFYLPQFHAIKENDEWWGEGFTEWVNVNRAYPMFEGHYQKHEPSELGYYNLVEDRTIQYKQIEMAKKYGIYGFCYYYYWFNGKRLLEKPLDQFLENKELDFPFCICWANESWSRRWDGQDKEVLMLQIHNEESDKNFINDIIPTLKDKRYIKVGEAPLLLIYRAELFPNMKETIQYWKKRCKEEGIDDLHISIVQSFGITSPEPYGADSAVEFPPHGVYAKEISNQIESLNEQFKGNIYDYREVVDRANKKNHTEYKLFRGCMLSWDNTARKLENSNIFNYANPYEYKKWLYNIKDYTCRYNDVNNQYCFINAWNEWAEGTHLEPDKKFGLSYLETTNEVINSR